IIRRSPGSNSFTTIRTVASASPTVRIVSLYTNVRGSLAMVSSLFSYQLVLWGLLWRCVILHDDWLNDCIVGVSSHRDAKSASPLMTNPVRAGRQTGLGELSAAERYTTSLP